MYDVPLTIVVPSFLTHGPSAVGSYPPPASRGHGPVSPRPRYSQDRVVPPPVQIATIAETPEAEITAALTFEERLQIAGLLRRLADAMQLVPGVHTAYRSPSASIRCSHRPSSRNRNVSRGALLSRHRAVYDVPLTIDQRLHKFRLTRRAWSRARRPRGPMPLTGIPT